MITVNIGLNNNAVENIYQYFMEHRGYNVVNFKIEDGAYNGVPEPTAVLELSTDYKLASKIIADFEKISTVMTQTCIAISSDEFDILVYNPNFAGQRQKFNNKYFVS
jgi:hypothetical protein